MWKKILIITALTFSFINLTSAQERIEVPIETNFEIGNNQLQSENIRESIRATYCKVTVNSSQDISRVSCQVNNCTNPARSSETSGCEICLQGREKKNPTLTNINTLKAQAEEESSDPQSGDISVTKEDVVNCEYLQVITGESGFDLLTNYISIIYTWAAGVVGTIAVLVIVISSIQITVAGGNSGSVETARGRITQSLTGLAIVFLSGLILYIINPGFFVL